MIVKKVKYTFYDVELELTKINKLINDLFEIISQYFERMCYINNVSFCLKKDKDGIYTIYSYNASAKLLEIMLNNNQKILDEKIYQQYFNNDTLLEILGITKEYK